MFNTFKQAVQRQFNEMKKKPIYRSAADPDMLWNHYLQSFPEGTNPIFKERTEHDCSCCRQFIRQAGGMVTIPESGPVITIWDDYENLPEPYRTVSESLSNYVKSHPIENVYRHYEMKVGTDKNYDPKNDRNWEHFSIQLPNDLVRPKASLGSLLSDSKSTYDVFLRGMVEITDDAMATVLELIAQGSLYRGNEFKGAVEQFRALKLAYTRNENKELFVWFHVARGNPGLLRLRNSVIGTLLVDLSQGVELERAVDAFGNKVDPTNYKRPTSLVTQKMVDQAKAKIEELGLTSALERRHATIADVPVEHALFVDRTPTNVSSSPFDEVKTKTPNLSKTETVTIAQFINEILPTAQSIEVSLDNKHEPNMVSLIAPQDLTAPRLFKWDNPFSWAYNGNLTDSIKERVKKAGGKVDGVLRCSLSWFNYDDLDLHMVEPGGYHIHYANKLSRVTSGHLDVDMNAGGGKTREPVENICYPDRGRIAPGDYRLFVNQYLRRETVDVGFEVEIEFDGEIHTLSYDKAVKGSVEVAVINYDGSKFTIKPALPSSTATKEFWGISSNVFHKVKAITRSPNCWGDKPVGNEHIFFVIDGAKNPVPTRGYFNEYLRGDLDQHRKVMEIVGSKCVAPPTDDQVSGVGFSTTLRNSLLVKVTGKFTRTLKVLF